MLKEAAYRAVLVVVLGSIALLSIAWLGALYTIPENGYSLYRAVELAEPTLHRWAVTAYVGHLGRRCNSIRVPAPWNTAVQLTNALPNDLLDGDSACLELQGLLINGQAEGVVESTYGWPMPFIRYSVFYKPAHGFTAGPTMLRVDEGIQIPISPTRSVSTFPTPLCLPTNLLVGPFLCDLLVVTCLVSILCIGPRALQRAHRKRLGLCLNCGYILRDSERCSECGHQCVKNRLNHAQ